MKKVLIISTGGTFNKKYNSQSGNLDIVNGGSALAEIAKHTRTSFEVLNIIDKDSLDMNKSDRATIATTIKNSKYKNIVVIHGTDTMDKTARYLAKQNLKATIILTGAMVPYSIDPIESTANLSMALGYIQASRQKGVYIAMNGVVDRYQRVVKNREVGRFEIVGSDF